MEESYELLLHENVSGNVNVETPNNGQSTSRETTTLPIDMQFNDGHIVSISVYSVLFIFSAIGKIAFTFIPFQWRILIKLTCSFH